MEHFSLHALSELPLLQGLAREELNRFATTVPHQLKQYAPDDILLSAQAPCRGLWIMTSGTADMSRTANNGRFTLHELAQAPMVIQPEVLYGIAPRHTAQVCALSPCQVLFIPKEGVTQLMQHYEVFRLNMLNMLSATIYKRERQAWHDRSGGTEKRITQFLHALVSTPAGQKTLDISMQELAHQIHTPRMKVSAALAGMQAKGQLQLSRRRITVPAMEQLIQAYS